MPLLLATALFAGSLRRLSRAIFFEIALPDAGADARCGGVSAVYLRG